MIKLKYRKQLQIDFELQLDFDGIRKSVWLDYLGSGQYCKAYTDGIIVYLLVPFDEYGKDILRACQHAANKHIPKIEYIDDLADKGLRLFKMPYIRTITAKDKIAWGIMKALEKSRLEQWTIEARKANKEKRSKSGYDISFATIANTDIPASVKEALELILGSMANYGASFCFEFNKRNIGVGSKGNIIFRDCVFDIDKLRR